MNPLTIVALRPVASDGAWSRPDDKVTPVCPADLPFHKERQPGNATEPGPGARLGRLIDILA